MPELDSARASTIVASLKTYYALSRNASNLQKQTIIQDTTLKQIFHDFSSSTTPEMALYFCKLLIILSDHPQRAYLMREQGYADWVGIICEQPVPPKLIEKFLRVQSRLLKAKLDAGDDKKISLDDKPKPPKRTTKELTFVLPILSEQLQGAISQRVLDMDGCISVSFRSDVANNETRCFMRCKAYVETRKIANEIIRVGFDGVEFLHKNEDGNEEVFTFYRDENASPTPADNMPQYLDDNIEVFDPTSAVVTNDFKSNAQRGWLSSIMSFW